MAVVDKPHPSVYLDLKLASWRMRNTRKKRDDIHVIFVPCNEIAEEIGDKKLLNMVAVGALLTVLPEITLQDVEKALEAHLPARHKHLLPKNYEALRRGFEAAQRVPA